MTDSPQKSSSSLGTILIVLGGAAVVGVAIIGVLAALAIYGVRKYIAEAKTAEGKHTVMVLANGICACAEGQDLASAAPKGLPPSSGPVPVSLNDVSGRKYMSAPADWSDPAYACASFSVRDPQYFQYQWQRDSASSGRAVAQADLDGDGSAEYVYQVSVSFAAGSCSSGALETVR